MQFRPCIDIHNGAVKQIVGGSLTDAGNMAKENFVSEQDGAFYAKAYRSRGIKGGHIILLNHESSEYYEATRVQAMGALAAYPGGLQIGGGITPANAKQYLEAGASHVIVTSYVFSDGNMDEQHLQEMVQAVGKEHLVLDLSCRKRDGQYYIVTDRWQKFTNVVLNTRVLASLAGLCDEFLIHAVDVEGKAAGIDEKLVAMLADCEHIGAVTYAGGVGSFADLEQLRKAGKNRINVTIGSALDLFGGNMPFDQVIDFCNQKEKC